MRTRREGFNGYSFIIRSCSATVWICLTAENLFVVLRMFELFDLLQGENHHLFDFVFFLKHISSW